MQLVLLTRRKNYKYIKNGLTHIIAQNVFELNIHKISLLTELFMPSILFHGTNQVSKKQSHQ